MIVTRSWLEEFIDLKDTTDEQLFEIFNTIGLEVGKIEKLSIPNKIVIGEIISCEKHPDADKLNVCKVDVGSGIRQIVCGASNVVDAKYVAVAMINAVMPDGLEIKPTTLRGIDSEGMICSASELGMPKLNNGIMILDDSIGELEIGKEISEYSKLNDTIFELELTPNRGDCLSILGVARDLAVVLNTKLIEPKPQKSTKKTKIGISRDATLHINGDINANIEYMIANTHNVQYSTPLLVALRLAIIGKQFSSEIDAITKYSIHTIGVILRCYSGDNFKDKNSHININITKNKQGSISLLCSENKTASIVGIMQDEQCLYSADSESIIIEASYIEPISIHETDSSFKKDELYYITSRGSNPSLDTGVIYLSQLMEKYFQLEFHEGTLMHKIELNTKSIIVDLKEIYSIIGQDIEKSKVHQILKNLGFTLSATKENSFVAATPQYRHDIENIQDISEEILRIIGINQIESTPLMFKEMVHGSSAISDFRNKKNIRNRCVANGFDEALTYVFSDSTLLEKYGFELIEKDLELLNPIVKELDTLRSTILINLLTATQKNINYGKKTVRLFEIGSVFGSNRVESEKIAFLWSGQSSNEGLINNGKPNNIQFSHFLEKLYGSLGSFELAPCSHKNRLIHPYQSADIIIDNMICGYISKLHPTAQDDFGIYETFIAELDVKYFYTKHINASPISNFQGVYKDLSIVIDKNITYSAIKSCIAKSDLPLLVNFYPIDIYNDSLLEDKQSLTIRFYIQSHENTLNDDNIATVTDGVLEILSKELGATLR